MSSPGLIPARAGNTEEAERRPYDYGAHPRSRGEHDPLRQATEPVKGSSPLARGTLTGASVNHEVSGLIPARAGNTSISL